MYKIQITQDLISSFTNSKIEDYGKRGVREFFSHEALLKSKKAADLLTSGQEKNPIIIYYETNITENTTIITENKIITFRPQILDEEINYTLRAKEKTEEGVFLLGLYYHSEKDTNKDWGKIEMNFLSNDYLKEKKLEVSHPVYYELFPKSYGGSSIIDNDINFENEEELETFVIKASHTNLKDIYLQLKKLEEDKKEEFSEEKRKTR